MTIICVSTFLNSVVTGVIGNFVFTLFLIGGVQQFRYWYYLKRKFHNRIFETYWKRFPDEVVQTVTCRVKGRKIKFTGKRIGDNDVFEGEFIINPLNLKMGEGFHAHTGSDGFAFLKIIIKDNDTFFIEAPYTGVKENDHKNKVGFIIYQAFIWKRK